MDDFDRLVSCLSKLPGIGRRSAERIAMKVVRDPDKLGLPLAEALKRAKESICCCSRCGNITAAERNPCRICTDPNRSGKVICVVEDPSDITLLERSGGFQGKYHALMGKLSPMAGQGVSDIRAGELLKRVDEEGVEEIVLALNTDVEGDSTASFLEDMLKSKNVTISRLAFGLPAGSGISYSDPVTLARALKGRQSI